jgi:hypothetical protein
MLSPITQRQMARVQARYPDATLQELPSGAGLVTLPNMQLPEGWSHTASTIYFIVPAGYPGPTPDCFWSATVLSVGGNSPQASQVQNIPETPISCQWYSWHVTEAARNWNPNRDDLMTYVNLIMDRFGKRQ